MSEQAKADVELLYRLAEWSAYMDKIDSMRPTLPFVRAIEFAKTLRAAKERQMNIESHQFGCKRILILCDTCEKHYD